MKSLQLLHPTIEPSNIIQSHLTDLGFKMNGFDFYQSFAVTDLQNDWEEEIYVSFTKEGWIVCYPDHAKKDKLFKTDKGLLKYLNKEHNF